jgi:cysteine desulfurase / selenocysteine lyase
MTTSPSTSNPAYPDADVLARLANEYFAALPGNGESFLNLSTAARANPLKSVDLPNEDDLRKIPAGLAGVVGQGPSDIAETPSLADADQGFYFLKASETSSPGVIPVLRPDVKGFDPSLGTAGTNAVSAARPHASAGNPSVPGSQYGSQPIHTPGIEAGAQPLAGATPPFSAFEAPKEEHARAVPGALGGAVGLAPQGGLAAIEGFTSPHYFLEGVTPTSPRAPTDVALKPRSADIEILPDLGLPFTSNTRYEVPSPLTDAKGAPSLGSSTSKASAPSQDLRVPADTTGLSPYFLSESKSFSQAPTPETQSSESPILVPDSASSHPGFDVNALRRDFPILRELVHGKPLVWFDNAATTQRPQQVIDRISYFYAHENSNIHRAAHELAARATDAYEGAREKVRHFLNASSTDEIIFVRGTTEGINLIAKSWGKRYIGKDDEIVISWLEHHANIVPWQQLCAETGAKLRVIPVDDDGQILLDEYEKLLNSRTKLVSFTQVSNALGTVTPAKEMIAMAHRHGAHVLLDGAQGISHMPVDVQDLDADWYVFSGHKVFGPTGIGAVYGKKEILNATPPWQGGGNMIVDVTHEKTIYHEAPGRFEAGTGNIADAVGLGAAIDYVQKLGMENIGRYEHELVEYATAGLKTVPGIRLVGTAKHKASVVSFVLPGFDNNEIGQALNRQGIAVRTGHHCAQPILRRFGLETSVRPSLALYNTFEEIDRLVDTVHRIKGGSYGLTR